jgi:c-di-GMP-binding flagellar brake protein YcgR
MTERRKEGGNGKFWLGIARFEKEIPEKNLERRRYPRFLLNLPLEYSHLDSSISYSSRTINVSEGGLMICVGERLKAGQHLNLKIFCPCGSTMLTIKTIVEVRWTDEYLGKDGNYRHGVKFIGMTPEDQQNFKGFLESYISIC